jgi:hypothetical protein
MVYEYVVGPSEVVHLTIGAKRRYGHFLCEAHQIGVESGSEEGAGVEGDGFEEMGVDVVDEDEERVGVDCGCRVLVGGRESRRLEQSALAMVRVCRRMYVLSLLVICSGTLCLQYHAYIEFPHAGTPKLYPRSTDHIPSRYCISHTCCTSPRGYRRLV